MAIDVAMVNTERTRGGAARVAALLTSGINRYADGVKSVLYHCEDRVRSEGYRGLRRPLSRPLNAALARLGGAYCVLDMGVSRQIIAAAADADVLHVHNLHGYYLDFDRLLRAWRDRPIVWTWHDMWGASGRCGANYSCDRWRMGCPGCPELDRYPAAFLDWAATEFRRKSELYKALRNLWIVSPSDWLAKVAVDRGFSRDQVHVIENPVDTDCFRCIEKSDARAALGLVGNKFTVLFMASDCGDPRKGFRDFSEATQGEPWQVIAVGRPPPSAAEHVVHSGPVADPDSINLYYAAADVMVIPSYAENYPNSVIESLASGTPVVGYREGGIPSQLTNPYSAVVEKGDTAALAKELRKRYGAGGKTPAMALELSTQAAARWSVRQVVDRYTSLYRQALRVGEVKCHGPINGVADWSTSGSSFENLDRF